MCLVRDEVIKQSVLEYLGKSKQQQGGKTKKTFFGECKVWKINDTKVHRLLLSALRLLRPGVDQQIASAKRHSNGPV